MRGSFNLTAISDPYVMDLSQSDGTDAPVLTAMHGTGAWNFSEVANSFEDFLITLCQPAESSDEEQDDVDD